MSLSVAVAVAVVAGLLCLSRLQRAQDGPEEEEPRASDQLVQKARSSLKDFNPSKRNIAVCGPLFSGKSTMVNALQGVGEDEPGAAKAGDTEIKGYPIRDSHLVVWDLPGWGTELHPFEGYFEDKHLNAFDEVILTYSSGLDENTVALHRQCRERQVPVRLVRTQADKARDAKMRRMTLEQAIAEMKADFAKELNELDGSVSAFYVSMWDYVDGNSNMDEKRFVEQVLKAG